MHRCHAIAVASPDELIEIALAKPDSGVAVFDNCGVGPAARLIAAWDPVDIIRFDEGNAAEILSAVERYLERGLFAAFTVGYDLGFLLEKRLSSLYHRTAEPPVWLALYDRVYFSSYGEGRLMDRTGDPGMPISTSPTAVTSNFSRESYILSVEAIQRLIAAGETYQANLTQKLRFELAEGDSDKKLFRRLRRRNPARYSAYIDRGESVVVSSSPESFFRTRGRRIVTSPIKGTIRRGETPDKDSDLRAQLAGSIKDRAENTMIVDLLRNDLGRICRYGSVEVENLCAVEGHPTLFHLVSTITGELRKDVGFLEIMRALFPCGSITGAPKVRTMEIIDYIESTSRGLSMGAFGYHVPVGLPLLDPGFDAAVAIRTVVIRDRRAEFNVGGGIVSDSVPAAEYDESLLKSKAILSAAGISGVEMTEATGKQDSEQT